MEKSNELLKSIGENHLIYFDNYGVYSELVKTGYIKIETKDLSNSQIINTHFKWIHNVLLDGIDNPDILQMFIEVEFEDNEIVNLTIFDYYVNLMFWVLPATCGDPITSDFLFFEENITRRSIKNYIDTKLLDRHRTDFLNIQLNNIIDDTLSKFRYIDEFSMYFMNTINNEDTIKLMNENQQFDNYIHSDLSYVPLEDVKDVGMKITNKAVDIIKNSDHCLSDSFRTGEGVNIKQFKEFAVNIGTKPDGNGSILNTSINRSYATGGIQSISDQFEDATTGRLAEMLKKKNVGDSGHMSRLVGLNNSDTLIYPDPSYSCNTRNLVKVTIENNTILNMFKNRWYKERPDGIYMKISSNPLKNEQYLLGKTLYFRSPMTCVSHAKGKGICYKCYGELAYTNADINIGKISAEIIWSQLTQKLLSAKHLLESKAKGLKWTDSFYQLFEFNANTIIIKQGLNLKNYSLLISDVETEDDYDKVEYNEYVLSFEVNTPEGVVSVHTETSDNIYLSNDLLMLLDNKHEVEDGKFMVTFTELNDKELFLMIIQNDELSSALYSIRNTIDRVSETESRTKDEWLQEFLHRIVEGGITVDAIHCEVILSNQIRSVEDVLENVDWSYPNAKYQLLTLKQSLTNNKNICISLEHEQISKMLYNPNTFRKRKPSQFDLFFMERPQKEMDIELVEDDEEVNKEPELINLVERIED